MAFKKEEFQALLEREGVMDFIWARSFQKKGDLEIFELANDRWGTMFFIHPPAFVDISVQNQLASIFNGIELPAGSSVQFFSFASRNLSDIIRSYDYHHSNFANVENTQMLGEMKENMINWFKKHANESIFGDKVDIRARNFLNVVTVTIPKYDKHKVEFSPRQILSYFNRFRSQLSFLYPRSCSQVDYVKIMRELLVPDQPLWNPPEDRNTFLNAQVVDNDSTMVLEDDFGMLGIGKMIPKEEFERREMNAIESSRARNKGGILADIVSMFKKKEEDERIAYTKWHAKVLTTKLYPPEVSLSLFASTINDYFGERDGPLIPCPFFVSMIVYFEDREKMKTEITEKANWNMFQTRHLGKAAKFFPKIVERAKEAEVVNKLVSEGMGAAYSTLSIVLMDDSIEKVEHYAELVKTEFLNKTNWVWQDETLIPHWIFLYHLPMNFEPFVLKTLAKRMNTVFSENIATITPLITGFKGLGAPILNYIDREGQVCGIDIFDTDTNYNVVVTGQSGSGKSYAMNDLFLNYLMKGAKIRVIDIGKSYKSLCEFVGGKYIEFDSESDTCFNFFTNIKLDKNGKIHEEELESIIPLIGLMAGESFYPEDIKGSEIPAIRSKIERAVHMAYEMKQNNAGMQEVVIALQKMQEEYKKENRQIDQALANLIDALYPFGDPDGEYFRFFNGKNNVKFEDNDFVVIEMENLEQKTQLKPVIIASFIHMIGREFFLGDRNQPKILAIDEAWSFLKDRQSSRYVENNSRRIRKYYGSIIVITQSIADLTINDATKAILANSAWRFFFTQNKDAINMAENDPSIGLDAGKIFFLGTIKKKDGLYSEVMVEKSGGPFVIARVVPDRVAHWIYTHSPADSREIERIMKEKGISSIDARLIKGYSERNDTTIEEEFIRRRDMGLLKFTGVQK